MVLFSNPKAQYLSYKNEIDKAIAQTLDSGWYILGEQARLFEEEFAKFIDVKHAIGVGSGTEALHVALKACGVGPGDEVITVSHTAVATISAIELCGAVPVFADIEENYFTLDAAKLEQLITKKTKVIIPVHLYGQAADIDRIKAIAAAHNVRVIEDCAQCHGARSHDRRLGSIADIACFSFYPTKNLGAIGDGGAVVTNNPELAEKCRLLREYGWADRYISKISGWNTRLDEIQAAVLRIKLKSLDADNDKRARIAALYDRHLGDSGLIVPKKRKDATHVYHLYVVQTKHRDNLREFLRTKGIGTGIHYPVPVHQQQAYFGRLRGADNLPVTEQMAPTILSLPIYPELQESDVMATVDGIVTFQKQTL